MMGSSMKVSHAVLAYLVLLGVLVTGTLADKGCTKLVVTYDDAQDHTETCAAVDDGITTVVVPYGSWPIVRGIYTRVPSDDGPTLDKYYSLAVRLANSSQPLRKLGRGYSGFPVANLHRNESLVTREYNVSEASCRVGLEVCAIVDTRSSGRRVNNTRGCMLIKCVPPDEPVPTPTRNVTMLVSVPASPCANCTCPSNATSHSGPVPTRPVAFSGGTPDTETSVAPPASSNTQDLYFLFFIVLVPLFWIILYLWNRKCQPGPKTNRGQTNCWIKTTT